MIVTMLNNKLNPAKTVKIQSISDANLGKRIPHLSTTL